MSTIMKKFPRKLKPRAVQENALLALEKHWNTADIFVVNLPVASGKSAIALTIAGWAKKASIITPTKLLVGQYKHDYPSLHVLKAKADYWCETFEGPLTKRPQGKGIPKLCSKEMECLGCDGYRSDLRKARVMPYLLSNYYIYLAHKLYRDTLIIDEAHCLIDVIKQMASKKLWHFTYKFPTNLRGRDGVKEWANSDKARRFEHLPEFNFLKEELNSYRPKYLIEIANERYRNEDIPCIRMVPLDVRDAPPIMWPDQVKKIILMSATFSRKDIEQLGLADKTIKYIEADSPIHYERRPVLIPETSVSMAWKLQDQNVPRLCEYITEVATHHAEDKGLVHATYSLARKIQEYHWPKEIRDRLIFHDNKDKSAKYLEFRDSQTAKIIIASGMYEGIDLPYEAGRWQILAKIPWPSLADPAIKHLCEQDEEWYNWETLKSTLQACGRICRTPEDFGATYIFDSSFKRLYNKGIEQGLVPVWFQKSVKWGQ